MSCCLLGVIAVASLCWSRLRSASLHASDNMACVHSGESLTSTFAAGLPGVPKFASPGQVFLICAMLAPLLALVLLTQHYEHYVTRARANDRTLLAEMLAQPICNALHTVRAQEAKR